MLASAAGAVVAASIASLFGVKGTIVGVAIGSAAATMGTAFVAQSIDRTHHAVRQVVVRAPDTSLLRRLGGTNAAGAVTESTPVTDTPATEAPTSTEARIDETATAATAATAATPITSSGPATAVLPELVSTEDAPKQWNWRVVAETAAIVFLLVLLLITVVELVAGKPLADLFGGSSSGSGTTVQNIFRGSTKTKSPTTSTTTVPVTSTPSTSAGSTTSTTGGSTTTTTSRPTTTTSLPTTTTSSGVSTTTTVAP